MRLKVWLYISESDFILLNSHNYFLLFLTLRHKHIFYISLPLVWHAASTHRCSPILYHWPNALLILNQVFGSPQEAQQLHMPLHLLHGLVNWLTFGSYRINQTALGPLIGWQSFSCPTRRCTYSRGRVGIPLYLHIVCAPFTSSTFQSPPPPSWPLIFYPSLAFEMELYGKRIAMRSLGHVFSSHVIFCLS